MTRGFILAGMGVALASGLFAATAVAQHLDPHPKRVVIAGEEQAEAPSIAYWCGLAKAGLDRNSVVCPAERKGKRHD